MKEIEIKYNGLKVKHLIHLSKIDENLNLKGKVEIISAIIGVKKEDLYRIDAISFNTIWDMILRDMQPLTEKKEFNKVITINNQKYKFIDPKKQSVGWYVDATQLTINPETMMALCYIPIEAKTYNDEDDDGNPLYDVIEREKIMMDADLGDFMALNAFFLKTWRRLEKKIIKMATIEIMRRKKWSYLLTSGLK